MSKNGKNFVQGTHPWKATDSLLHWRLTTDRRGLRQYRERLNELIAFTTLRGSRSLKRPLLIRSVVGGLVLLNLTGC